LWFRGGSVVGAVSSNTDFVVTGEEAGTKLEKARSLGVPILTEKAFLDMIEPGNVANPEWKQRDIF